MSAISTLSISNSAAAPGLPAAAPDVPAAAPGAARPAGGKPTPAMARARGPRGRARSVRVRPAGSSPAGLRPAQLLSPQLRPAGVQPGGSVAAGQRPRLQAPWVQRREAGGMARVVGAPGCTTPAVSAFLAAPALPSSLAPRPALRTRPALPTRLAPRTSSAVAAPAVAEQRARVVRGRARMTRRGRLVVTTLVAALVVALTAVAAGAFSGAPSVDQQPVVYRSVTVEPGQSLWEIAESVAPGTDPRSTVRRIVELNNLASPTDVRAGQQVAVPGAPGA